jgi:hypothetical protein
MFGWASLAVMWDDTSAMSGKDLSDIGFRKVAGTELLIRHLSARTPFNDGQSVVADDDYDTGAKPEHEEWVMKRWTRSTHAEES